MLVPPILIPFLPFTLPFSILFPRPCMVPCCKSVCDQCTLTYPFFFFPGTECPLACMPLLYHDTAKVPISRLAPRTPARPVLENAHPSLPVFHPRSRTRAPSDLPRLQRYSHIDRVNRRLVLGCGCVLMNIVYP